MQTQYSRIKMLASFVSPPPFVQKPKIAFLFIARNRIPLDVVWDAFFQGEKENRFSIFVHSRPGFLLNKATTRSSFFYDRQLNDSIQVDWGESSMLLAERILLKSALSDPFNERFVFLSDSCIPLYNFSYIYDYIMLSSTSFVDSTVCCPFMWAALIRKHAIVIVRDDTVYPMFQRHCRRRSLPEFWRDHPLVSSPNILFYGMSICNCDLNLNIASRKSVVKENFILYEMDTPFNDLIIVRVGEP
ncbi:Glycosyltransferase bc10 [Asimina triloba]